MTKDEALTLALEALTYCEALNRSVQEQKMHAITAIKEALAQPERKFDPNDSFARDEAAAARVREFMRNH